MAHPFHEYVADQSRGSARKVRSIAGPLRSRRLFFFQGLGAMLLMGWSGLGRKSRADQPPGQLILPPGERRYTTQALGEEGAAPPPNPERHPERPTTMALGEEGAGPPPADRFPPRQEVTTQALGEEGNPPPRGPIYTTFALGEEGNPPPQGPTYTTYALGEEGNPPRRRWRRFTPPWWRRW